MNMSGAENRMTGQQNDAALNNRVLNTQNIGNSSIGHSQQVIDFRNANNARPQGKSPRISKANIGVIFYQTVMKMSMHIIPYDTL